MSCKFEFNVNNFNEVYEINKLAKQSNGSVLLKIKNTVLLANIVIDADTVVEEDFLPLAVQYLEKSYSAGKIPGGFVKREQKPGEFEALTARVIDRSIRPLFPKGFKHPTQLIVMVLSVDPEVDLQIAALNAAAAALYISDIPIKKSVCGVRVAKIDGDLVINPTLTELKESTLDMLVSGTKDEILMIEMKSISSKEANLELASEDLLIEPAIGDTTTAQSINELNEDDLVDTITFAQSAIKEATTLYEEYFEQAIPEELVKIELQNEKINDGIYAYIDELHSNDIKEAVNRMAKSERNSELKNISKEISKTSEAQKEGWELDEILKVVEKYKRNIVRAMIINDNIRADGRGLKDVRPIAIETNILPNAHSSTLFTRGETQALVVATLGGEMDAQTYDNLTNKGAQSDRFMVHYNFYPFCVGETKQLAPPSRRELGHGNLAKKALEPTIDLDYDGTIRLVSEILESNGSSSMATICGGSLALRAAGIETQKMVAGVAMGLVFEDDKYAVLTDILGLEDHDGDMDFKVAGTKDGITALQMDIKLGGIALSTLKEALNQAKEARTHILGLMEEANEKIVINESILPSTTSFLINPSKIVEVIGQAGKTIKEIVDRFEVSIDLSRENGKVRVSGSDKAKVIAACDHIKTIANAPSSRDGGRGGRDRDSNSFNFEENYKSGEVYTGVVKRIVDFGAFIELPKGGEGLLHISKLSKDRVNNIRDVLNENQEVEVKILGLSRNRAELGLADS